MINPKGCVNFMVVRSKFKFKKILSFLIALVFFAVITVFGLSFVKADSVFNALFFKYKKGGLPLFLYPAANLYPPISSGSESSALPENEPLTSSDPISSDSNSSKDRLYFKSKTANLFPTESEGLSYYGRVFVNAKGIDVKKLLEKSLTVKSKTVLILCSHFTEGYSDDEEKYYPDSQNTEDISKNVFSAAVILGASLERLGARVIICDTAFDSPYQNGAFERSGQEITALIEKNPDISLVIDLHRDSLKEENLTGIRTAASYGGTPVAQLSLSVPENGQEAYCEDSRVFALKLQQMLESECPTITRPVTFLSGNYGFNGDVLRVILTVGSQSNTVAEAESAAKIAAKAIFAVLSQEGNDK